VSHSPVPPDYRPTILLGALAPARLDAVKSPLEAEGWDVRTMRDFALETDPAPGSAVVIAASRSIQPDLILTAGSESDPWAFKTICELRSDPATQDLGVVVFPEVSVPSGLAVTPMSGPDAWIFPETPDAEALETIRKTIRAGLAGRLEWAQREWTPTDRFRHTVKSARVRIELGRTVEAATMGEWLYGRRNLVDLKIWDGTTEHPRGWRFGRAKRYRRPLLVEYEEVITEDSLAPEQHFTFYARSGRLLLAACHAVSDLAGGWPVLEAG